MPTIWGAADMRRYHRGFSLVEVLVTILLIAIGLLGMMAMQGRAIQYTADSLNRTQAVLLANELIEILRSTPTSATDDGAFYFNGSLPGTQGSCLELATSTLVEDQINCWGNKVRRLLPGTGTSDVASLFRACLSDTPDSCGTGAALEVRIAWQGSGDECGLPDEDAQVCTYQVRTQI